MKKAGWSRRKIVGEMFIKGFNASRVAENVGCSRQWVSMVINGHNPNLSPIGTRVRLELSRMLNVDYKEIWGTADPLWYSDYIE